MLMEALKMLKPIRRSGRSRKTGDNCDYRVFLLGAMADPGSLDEVAGVLVTSLEVDCIQP